MKTFEIIQFMGSNIDYYGTYVCMFNTQLTPAIHLLYYTWNISEHPARAYERTRDHDAPCRCSSDLRIPEESPKDELRNNNVPSEGFVAGGLGRDVLGIREAYPSAASGSEVLPVDP